MFETIIITCISCLIITALVSTLKDFFSEEFFPPPTVKAERVPIPVIYEQRNTRSPQKNCYQWY